ncbi:MAG: two-component system, chemotaxis family, protein-glutamate methylesterase/glutaminase, partial [Abditibacteriota bacterium]|nr:two-component system, chemotaxis family, protein-glutamate methylesterase/glutaminase [Abditibacteriota bacterium]
PECHGVLLQIKEGSHTRFRCHTGHAFSLNVLLGEITKSIEDSLWNTVRAIEEKEMLLNHLQQHLREANQLQAEQQVGQKVAEAKQQAEIVRQAVLKHEALSTDKLLQQCKPMGEKSQ